jgi:hypothetical protein
MHESKACSDAVFGAAELDAPAAGAVVAGLAAAVDEGVEEPPLHAARTATRTAPITSVRVQVVRERWAAGGGTGVVSVVGVMGTASVAGLGIHRVPAEGQL